MEQRTKGKTENWMITIYELEKALLKTFKLRPKSGERGTPIP